MDIGIRYSCWLIWHHLERRAFYTFWDIFRSIDGFCVMIDIASMLAAQVDIS
jgi:hypothetical protein